MKYLLDTCVISDFVKGNKNTLIKMKKTSPNEIAVSSITVMEIQYGIALNPLRMKSIEPVILELLATVTVLDFTQNDAEHAAKLRAVLKQQGRQIGSYDVLLAGTAINNQLTFVTSNTKEFNRVDGLELEDWR